MKRQNLLLIVFVAFIAGIVSIIVSNTIFGTPQSKPIKVPVVDKISPSFPDVHNDSTYNSFFNDKALNPTQLIQIGNGGNTKPLQDQTSQ